MKCRDGEKCAHITPMCAKGAAKCELQGICIPAQYAPPDSDEVQNSNVNAPRFGRDLNGESDRMLLLLYGSTNKKDFFSL